MPAIPTTRQEIDELKKRYEKLRDKRVAAETDLKRANEELDRLKKEAMEKYGTDDLKELTLKLEQMKEENERKRREYQEHLSQLESKLAEVDQQFGQAKG